MCAAFLPAAAILVLSLLFAPPSLADIYRWEDESGVIHFTDDLVDHPGEIQGEDTRDPENAARGRAPVPFHDGRSLLAVRPVLLPGAPNGDTLDRPLLPQDDDATLAEKLRAKIDAKERFIRGVDEKQSRATNPYRNRFVSPSDLELYRKYKDELPRRPGAPESARLPPLPRQGTVAFHTSAP